MRQYTITTQWGQSWKISMVYEFTIRGKQTIREREREIAYWLYSAFSTSVYYSKLKGHRTVGWCWYVCLSMVLFILQNCVAFLFVSVWLWVFCCCCCCCWEIQNLLSMLVWKGCIHSNYLQRMNKSLIQWLICIMFTDSSEFSVY